MCILDTALTRAGSVSAIRTALPIGLTSVSPSPHRHKPLPLSHPEVSQPGRVGHDTHSLACIPCYSFFVSGQQFVFEHDMVEGFLLHMLCEVADNHFIMDHVVISLKASVSTMMESSGFLHKNSCDA